MSNDIYRGKRSLERLGKSIWIEGELDTVFDEPVILVPKANGRKLVILIDPKTLGRYTKRIDKNGMKVFEGDIVRTHYANAPKAVFVETVIFDGGKFCATSTNEGCKTTAALWDGVPRLAIDKSVYMDEVEVIGNIHDNSELLGGDIK